MNNLQHFLLAYRHIKALSLPDDGNLKAHVRLLKTSADVIFEKILCTDFFKSLILLAEEPKPRVSLGTKREGRGNKA